MFGRFQITTCSSESVYNFMSFLQLSQFLQAVDLVVISIVTGSLLSPPTQHSSAAVEPAAPVYVITV